MFLSSSYTSIFFLWHASRERLPFQTPGSVPILGVCLCSNCWDWFSELAVSFLDFSHWIPLCSFSILLYWVFYSCLTFLCMWYYHILNMPASHFPWPRNDETVSYGVLYYRYRGLITIFWHFTQYKFPYTLSCPIWSFFVFECWDLSLLNLSCIRALNF